MITKKYIFKTVKEHLLKQKKRSENKEHLCLYRNKDNLKCAIGVLIPDELYKIFFEDNVVVELLETYSEKDIFGDELEEGSVELMRMLQNVHDVISVDRWEIELKYIENILKII